MNSPAAVMKALLDDKEVWQEGWGFRLNDYDKLEVYEPRIGCWTDAKGCLDLEWDKDSIIVGRGDHLSLNKAVAAMFEGNRVESLSTGVVCWFEKGRGIMCSHDDTTMREFDPTDSELRELWRVI